jgi:hypothetical protein
VVPHQREPTGFIFDWREIWNELMSLLLKSKEQIALCLAAIKGIVTTKAEIMAIGRGHFYIFIAHSYSSIKGRPERPCGFALATEAPLPLEFPYPVQKILPRFRRLRLSPNQLDEKLVRGTSKPNRFRDFVILC